MRKFPKVLSPERLSLLSAEDRKIYEQEHAAGRTHGIFDTDHLAPIFEDVDQSYDDMGDSPAFDLGIDEDALVEEELRRVYDELFSDIISEDDFFASADELNEAFQKADAGLTPLNESASPLNEGAEGLDCMAWLRGIKLGWLGKIAMAGLAALGTGIAALLIAGKDKLAMIRLKKYMNRIVEIMDQGI